jgi:hypothetical protein
MDDSLESMSMLINLSISSPNDVFSYLNKKKIKTKKQKNKIDIIKNKNKND